MKKGLQTVLSVSGGTLVGFINGFFGGGGGMLCVPLLEKVLGEHTKIAHATAILIILPITVASAITYVLGGIWETVSVLTTASGVVAGGIVGALLLKVLPPKLVAVLFALMMIGVGIRLTFF